MGGATETPPRYVAHVEGLLQTSFFYDQPRSHALRSDFESLSTEELGARREIYIGALGIIGRDRILERTAAIKHEGLSPQAWNSFNRYTLNRIGKLAAEKSAEVTPLSRRLAMLNHAEQSLAEGYATQGLYEHQTPFLEGIVYKLQKSSAPVTLPPWWKTNDKFWVPGVTVTGPTGIGKTAIMARTAEALGAGQVLPIDTWTAEANPPVSVLGVVPTQQLIGQLLGKAGSDTFRRLAPGVKVGSLYQYDETLDADVVFMTIDMVNAHLRENRIKGRRFDAMLIDETHHLTEPQFLTTFLREWSGITIGFSATPAYHGDKDVRHILRYEVTEREVVEYIGRELNDLELYSFIVHPDDVGLPVEIRLLPAAVRRFLRQEAVSKKAIEFATPLITEGRRGLMFCEPGEGSDHAQRLADQLNKTRLPDGRYIRADTLGSFRGGSDSPKNRAILNKLNQGEIDVATTTYMGQEALDIEELNFIAVLCKITSELKLYQIGGRGLRRSRQFRECVLANFNTTGFGQNPYYAQTFAGVYFGDIIEQGVLVSSKPRSGGGGKGRVSKVSDRMATFSPAIQSMLERINHKSLAKVYLGQEEREVEIPPDYKPLHEIIAGKDISPQHARYQLLRAGYSFIGRSEGTPDGPIFVRYYEPAAETFFTAKPQPPKDGLLLGNLIGYADRKDIMTLADIGKALKTNPKVITRDYLTDEENKQGKTIRISGEGLARAWPNDKGEAIIARLRQLLVFPPHLVPAPAVANRIRIRYETLAETIRLRRQKLRDDYQLEAREVQRGNRRLIGVPWLMIRELERKYGIKPGQEPYDYAMLPTSAEDDPQKIAYARQLQRSLGMHASWLPPDPSESDNQAMPTHEQK